MKMQEVILELRDRVPVMEKEWGQLSSRLDAVADIAKDFKKAENGETRKVLTEAVIAYVEDMKFWRCELGLSVDELVKLNAEYKEKLGPKARKPKDAEGQQMLPGMGEVAHG